MGELDFAGIDPIIVCGEVGRHKHVLSEPARKFAVGAFRTERQIVFEGPFVRNKGPIILKMGTLFRIIISASLRSFRLILAFFRQSLQWPSSPSFFVVSFEKLLS